MWALYPARDQVRIDIGSNDYKPDDIISVEILNSSGQTLNIQYSTTKTGLILNVQHLNVGMYIVRLKTDDKSFISKFIKL